MWPALLVGTRFPDSNQGLPERNSFARRTIVSRSSGVTDTEEFSVNVPSADMVEITDYTGIVSGRSIDKSGLFEVFYGELKSAPMIKACPIAMECKVVETVSLPTNTFFIGEIVAIYSEEQFLTDGDPDVKKINPFVLTMPDNRYWSIGECIGKAWNAGITLRERLTK